MAKYTVTHTCNHQVDHQITGPVKGRQNRADWLATQPCTACKRGEATQAAAKANSALPALEGTDKQIAWAETIRATQVAKLTELRDRLVKIANSPEVAAKVETIIAAEINRTKASEWIDTRDMTYGDHWIVSQLQKD